MDQPTDKTNVNGGKHSSAVRGHDVDAICNTHMQFRIYQ